MEHLGWIYRVCVHSWLCVFMFSFFIFSLLKYETSSFLVCCLFVLMTRKTELNSWLRECSQKGKHTHRGKNALGFYFNSGGKYVFSPLAWVQPFHLIVLASLKRTDTLEIKAEGERGHCSKGKGTLRQAISFLEYSRKPLHKKKVCHVEGLKHGINA